LARTLRIASGLFMMFIKLLSLSWKGLKTDRTGEPGIERIDLFSRNQDIIWQVRSGLHVFEINFAHDELAVHILVCGGHAFVGNAEKRLYLFRHIDPVYFGNFFPAQPAPRPVSTCRSRFFITGFGQKSGLLALPVTKKGYSFL
jgi:hypothetical protein